MKFVRVLVLLIGLPILIFSAFVIGMNRFGGESARTAILQQVTPYFLLPAYVALIAFALTKHKVLTGLSALVVIFHLTTVIPPVFSQQPSLSAAEKQAPTFTVFSQNIRFDNETPQAPADAIRNTDADFVLLQEVTWQNWHELEDAGTFDNYPHSFISQAGTDGLALWSKHPLTDTVLLESAGFPTQRVRTVVNEQELTIFNVHTRAPVNESSQFWYEDFETLRDRLSSEGGAVVSVGDYNASHQHPSFRAVLNAGFTDAAPAAGKGFSRTWPLDRALGQTFGGFVRLDHALFNKSIRVREFETLPPNGSDHRAIFAEFTFADH